MRKWLYYSVFWTKTVMKRKKKTLKILFLQQTMKRCARRIYLICHLFKRSFFLHVLNLFSLMLRIFEELQTWKERYLWRLKREIFLDFITSTVFILFFFWLSWVFYYNRKQQHHSKASFAISVENLWIYYRKYFEWQKEIWNEYF